MHRSLTFIYALLCFILAPQCNRSHFVHHQVTIPLIPPQSHGRPLQQFPSQKFWHYNGLKLQCRFLCNAIFIMFMLQSNHSNIDFNSFLVFLILYKSPKQLVYHLPIFIQNNPSPSHSPLSAVLHDFQWWQTIVAPITCDPSTRQRYFWDWIIVRLPQSPSPAIVVNNPWKNSSLICEPFESIWSFPIIMDTNR